MRRFRFHIGTLVILVLLLGVGFAALRESDETWDSSIFSVTLGVLLISILLAVHRSSAGRNTVTRWRFSQSEAPVNRPFVTGSSGIR